MRTFRFALIACAILLILTACSGGRTPGATSTGTGSSVRSVSREGRVSSRPVSREGRFSSRAASSVRSLSTSKGAPFFTLQSSSSRSVSSAITREAVSSAPTQPVTGGLKIHMDADRGEARAGDTLSYIITLKNTSASVLPEFPVTFGYVPAQLTVLESDGTTGAGTIQWIVSDLQPGQKRALRLRIAVSASLAHGEQVRTSVSAAVGTAGPQTASSLVAIINRLPATGLSDNTGPLENTRRFLSPFRTASSIPAIVWASTLVMGLALGASVAKKYL